MPHANLEPQSPISLAGRGAVSAAAYRSGEKLYDEREGRHWDYTRKQDVEASFILTPDGAADWMQDRETLWNHLTAMERNKAGQVAREVVMVIPRGLTADQRAELVRGFVEDHFVARGMVADVNLHSPEAGDGDRNYHAHVLLNMRTMKEDGSDFDKTKNKARQWNRDFTDGGKSTDPKKGGFVNKKGAGDGWVGENTSGLKFFQVAWDRACNDALEAAGSSERVEVGSIKDRGELREPQQKIGFNRADRNGWRANEVQKENAEIEARNETREYFKPKNYKKRVKIYSNRRVNERLIEEFFDPLKREEAKSLDLDQDRGEGFAHGR